MIAVWLAAALPPVLLAAVAVAAQHRHTQHARETRALLNPGRKDT